LETQTINNFCYPWNPQKIKELKELLNSYDEIIGHNFIRFDAPTLKKLLGVTVEPKKIVDTLVLSKLYHPNLEGGHSLGSWGERLNFPKGDYNDWSKLTEEMVKYCEQDLRVTGKTYEVLKNRLQEFGEVSQVDEHKTLQVIHRQIEHGWLLDQKRAYGLLAELKEKQMELEDKVHEVFKPLPKFLRKITPEKRKESEVFKKGGLKFLGDDWTTVVGVFSRVEFPEFNLGSRQQIGKYLQYFGWKPKEFTDKGQPKVDEEVLKKVQGIPEASLIAEYLLIVKRVAQVRSWVEKVEEDGRVHGSVDTIGAVTNRMTHSGPNMAQVPAVYSPYGKECRSCWVVPNGYKLVGCDAAGLELRMLAHYMNDEEYTNEILNGDIHTANQLAAGLATRDSAKTFIYAFLYGAGDAKIGSIVGGSAKAGANLKKKFLENTPSLADLRERVEKSCARGYLKGLDGRKLIIRSPHAALNTLLQSAGAIVMKKALTLLDEYATIWKLDYHFVGNIHDEVQVEVREDQADKFGYLAVECIKAAGVELNMRCPLDADYKVGDTWADTH